ncbi:hypothetical protein CKM354_000815500 [Cercospora kikuchii]|uniref:Uncharacterized protein n=1 Tax=Cercospora kikuchii TaxID=84275 RepID=A0A9P3FF13_9PEZI|nr:uncharacterized protein CKM354_000815500 [Cercospora kikuchii]GIZ44971.1 hypothetical protein CKM354_000815500 [Cercospora kikuchii]
MATTAYPTEPVYVHNGSWNDTSRKHPAMGWLETYTKTAIDGKLFDKPAERSKWMSDDRKYSVSSQTRRSILTKATPDVLVKSTGEVRNGGDASWEAISKELYAPFKEHLHSPTYATAVQTGSNTWELTGLATLFWKLQVPGQGHNIADPSGKTWDGAIPSAFKFAFREEGGQIRISRTEISSDPSAALVAMLKTGMLKPEDLMK